MARKPKLTDADEPESAATSEPREGAEADTVRPAEDGLRSEESELERAQRERDEYLASWQRSQADYQNMRRRMQQELGAHARRAKQPLLSDILLILDQLEMALAIPAQSEDAQSLRAGVELTRDQLTRALANEGVEPVPEGGTFDPAVHQAIATVETTDVEPGVIVETLRSGFTWGDIVLRYAQVRVAAAPRAGDLEPDET